jgi:hypothetical protein
MTESCKVTQNSEQVWRGLLVSESVLSYILLLLSWFMSFCLPGKGAGKLDFHFPSDEAIKMSTLYGKEAKLGR